MLTLRDNKVEVFIFISVLFLGAIFRIYDLGSPGFWGDEETSSMTAKSLAMGNGATFPSGMEYRRALPHTYLNALSAKVFGIDKDLSYRIPSSLFGIATLILIFFGVARFMGLYVALTVTVLLAFSEWHIILSRTARMYGPLLFFSVAFCFAALTWHYKTKSHTTLVLACILFLVASSFNYLAIIVLPILFVPVIFQVFEKKSFTLSLISTVIIGAASTIYFKAYVSTPYKEIKAGRLLQTASAESTSSTTMNSLMNLNMSDYFLLCAGLVLGSYIFFWSKKHVSFKGYPFISIGSLIATIAMCLFILYGEAYGILVWSFFILLFLSYSPDWHIKIAVKFIILVALAIILIIAHNVFSYGFSEGLKESLNYPFPYLLYQFLHFPGVFILFAVGALDSILSPANKIREIIKVLTIIILLPSVILGLVLEWAPPRYFITTYPLLLIVASYGFVCLLDKSGIFNNSNKLKLIATVLLPASGILGGHGIPQAVAVAPSEYGAQIYSNHLSGIKYPDHRSHGCFVKEHLQENDIIVAEDALQMYWYIGRVDYWLRSPSSIDHFLYLDNDNELKDIYVNSRPTTDRVISTLRTNQKNRIWIITSGETQQYLDHFLIKGTQQRQWLNKIISTNKPALIGRDSLSATYCINCKLQVNNVDPWNYDCR
jgi:hypothetical protein